MNSDLYFLTDAKHVDLNVVEGIAERKHPLPEDLDMGTRLYIQEIIHCIVAPARNDKIMELYSKLERNNIQ